MSESNDPAEFVAGLQAKQSDAEREKIQRYFKSGGDQFIGVKMGDVFALAKEFVAMDPAGIEELLESEVHEVRAGAMSIMDKSGRANKTDDERRLALHDLYLRRHDRINNWDLVDLGAPFVIGRYLFDKPRDELYELAKSEDMWERRTAIVATAYFIRQREFDDTYAIAEMLIDDDEDLIHKAVGGWVREAGKHDRPRLLAWLDANAARMPRTMLRYSIEHLDVDQKAHYRAL